MQPFKEADISNFKHKRNMNSEYICPNYYVFMCLYWDRVLKITKLALQFLHVFKTEWYVKEIINHYSVLYYLESIFSQQTGFKCPIFGKRQNDAVWNRGPFKMN